MNLSNAAINENYKIINIKLFEKFKTRLFELGVKEGGVVKIIKPSKNDKPVIIFVKNTFLALRLADAKNITVEKL